MRGHGAPWEKQVIIPPNSQDAGSCLSCVSCEASNDDHYHEPLRFREVTIHFDVLHIHNAVVMMIPYCDTGLKNLGEFEKRAFNVIFLGCFFLFPNH